MAVNVGLDIGTSAVRAALVNTGKGTPTLQRYGEVALPPGAVVGGEIVDEELVQGAISRLWKTAKLPKKRVVLGIANQRVIVRRVDLPYMAYRVFLANLLLLNLKIQSIKKKTFQI